MVNSGLEGIVAATTGLSDVDGERGELVIAGYQIGEVYEVHERSSRKASSWVG